MNTLHLPCPACGRALELPAAAVGRLGKCPACESTFTVGPSQTSAVTPSQTSDLTPSQTSAVTQPQSTGPLAAPTSPAPPTAQASPSRPVAATPPPSAISQGLAGPPAERATPHLPSPGSLPPFQPPADSPPADSPSADSPSQGGEHPFSVPLGSGTTEMELGRPPIPVMQSVAPMRTLEIGRSTIEEIFARTTAIFLARWSSLVVAFFIVAAVMAFVIFIPFLVISEIADAGGDAAAGLLTLVWVPIAAFFGGFLSVGLCRVALAIARNSTPSPISELMPPLSLVVRFLLGFILLSLLLGTSAGVLGGLLRALSSNADNEQVAALLSVSGAIVASVVLLIVQWLLWSWIWIVSDGMGTVLGSFRTSVAVTMKNKLTSALLVLVAIVLSALGAAMCSIGHVVTVPLTMTMFAVAYLQMTGQTVDDPNQQPMSYQPPPPAQKSRGF